MYNKPVMASGELTQHFLRQRKTKRNANLYAALPRF